MVIERHTKDEIYSMPNSERIALFERLLMSTGRKGIEGAIDFVRRSDFYTSPASMSYHSNIECGLLIHSLLVFYSALEIRDGLVKMDAELAAAVPEDSIIISALLHDLCKVSTYTKALKSKKINGVWKTVTGYECNDVYPLGHGEKSVFYLMTTGLEMRVEEMLAIRWHMGMNESSNTDVYSFRAARDKYPLVNIIMAGDYVSTFMFESVSDGEVVPN